MPQGDKRGAGWEFFDATYDGHWDAELQRGLGQLTDGKLSPDSFKMGYYDYHKGKINSYNTFPLLILFQELLNVLIIHIIFCSHV